MKMLYSHLATKSYVKALYKDGITQPVAYQYIYNYTDHLGNIRLSYALDEETNQVKTLEENHYYPFGLKHGFYNEELYEIALKQQAQNEKEVKQTVKKGYNYKYNGKELQDELGLQWYDYGARNYDASLSRFMNFDPLAEKYNFQSPYVYADNNPVLFKDINGMGTETDYFTNEGKKIGDDGVKNGINVVIDDKDLEKKMRKIFKKEGKVDILDSRFSNVSSKFHVIPSDIALNEALNVLDRAVSNGGMIEENSLVMCDKKIIRGKPGKPYVFGQKNNLAKTNLPKIPFSYLRFGVDLNGTVESTIHSHILKSKFISRDVSDRGVYFSLTNFNKLSQDDANTFPDYRLNIIVGRIEQPTIESNGITKELINGQLGISIYSRDVHLYDFDRHTVEKMINN